MLSDSYKMIGSCIDQVSKAVSQIERVRFSHAETNREKDFLSHTIATLKLELAKMNEYEQKLSKENVELGRKRSASEETRVVRRRKPQHG